MTVNSIPGTLTRVGKPWHEALAEHFILYPTQSMAEVAKFFNVSPAWLSSVKNSDAFQDYYQARRREHFDEVSAGLAEARVHQKLETLADLSLDAMTERMEDHLKKVPTRELSIDTLGSVANLALKNLGFGQAKAPVAPQGNTLVQNNIMIFNGDREALERAREKLNVLRRTSIDPNVIPEEKEKDEPLALTSGGSQAAA